MANRAYEPKVGSEGLVIETLVPAREIVHEDGSVEFDRQPGESFVVGTEEVPWPYATGNVHEQAVLDAHPQVKRVAVAEAESHDPLAEDSLGTSDGADEESDDEEEDE